MNSDSNSKTNYSKQLLDIRDAISEIDDSLISLIADRRKLSINVARIKQLIGKPLRDQPREKELLESLVEKASLLNIESRYITKLFTTIIEDSVRYQQEYLQAKASPTTKDNRSKSIAVLGGVGAYSHLAAKHFFANSENQYIACDSFDEIIQNVETGKTQYGVIPIENTTSGGITEVYDLLLNSKLSIIGEEKLAINHCLVTKKSIKLNEIRSIVAHPQAARQCSQDLNNLTEAKISLCESTAHALSLVATEKNLDIAAIASEQAAELFNLKVIQKNIANQKQNFTRFMVLSKKAIPVALTVQSKTTIALSTGQQPGSLAQVLALFENSNIPLSKLESRPIPDKPWEQLFYIDFQGNVAEPQVADALNSLSKLCKFLRVFGSYPSENIIATKVSSDSIASASLTRAELNPMPQPIGPLSTDISTHSVRRISPSHTLQESVVDLAGTLVGNNNFMLSALIANVYSEQLLEEQFNKITESGIGSCVIGSLLNFTVDNVKSRSTETSISKIIELASRHQLSLIFDVEKSQQLSSVVAHSGVPRITVNRLRQLDLLNTVGGQNTPIIIQQQTENYDELLDIAESILSKGNQQVVLELVVDCAHYTPAALTDIAKLRSSTHLPIIIHLVGKRVNFRILPSLVSGIRALGVNGVVLELTDNNQGTEANSRLMLAANDFAAIMTSI